MKMKMTRLILFSLVMVLVLGLASAGSGFEYNEDDLKSEEAKWALYERWRVHHNKPETDSDDEKHKRFVIFMDTVKRVDDHNKAKKPYLMELNRMSDLTFEEIGRMYTGTKLDQNHRQLSSRNSSRLKVVDRHNLPKEFDWRQHGVVNPPKDQGQCGSCWAFGAMGSLESAHAIRTGQLVSVSEQQIVDCDLEQGGCDGGVPAYALNYAAKHGGMTTTDCYPYVAQRTVCCGAKLVNRPVQCTGFDDVPPDDEDELLAAVAQQPVCAGLFLYQGFFNYKEGIYTGEDCVGNDNPHAVNVVGWGETPEGCKYWIIKNSWGEGWGEKGYMRLARDTGDPRGACWITQMSCVPTFDEVA
ncbi:hypothetical protein L6452_33685 [Arctium lappa]|uniref:Uncharacterized protein n=1 Tax=Arctium lappa TaxID=4217 RepID=A0ACB8YH93_ARCLA|nr:hypothetical protein L6452_33685 [Arctium lappa]